MPANPYAVALDSAVAAGPSQNPCTGVHVARAAALHPDQTTEDIFSIDGGLVVVTGILGLVTVAVPAAHDYSLVFDPDLGGSNITLADTLTVDSDPAGSFYTLNDTVGGALVVSTDIRSFTGMEQPFILEEGDIAWTTAGGGTVGTTTRVRWDIWYWPIDDGATISAV